MDFSTLIPLTDYPEIGQIVYENNQGWVKYQVDETYLRDDYPEVITLRVMQDFGNGHFKPGHISIRRIANLLTESV